MDSQREALGHSTEEPASQPARGRTSLLDQGPGLRRSEGPPAPGHLALLPPQAAPVWFPPGRPRGLETEQSF